LAFTRNPSDTSVSPATYTADGASDLLIVDQQRNIAIDGSDKNDAVLVDTSALSSNALYNYNARGFAGADEFVVSASLIQDSVFNGNVGDDELIVGNFKGALTDIGTIVEAGLNTSLQGSYILGGKGNDFVGGAGISNGELNGNIGDDTIVVDNESFATAGFNMYVGGGQGNDQISINGNFTSSIIDGNKGTDTIIIEDGTHSGTSVNGGEGGDILRVESGSSSKGLMLNGDLGNDTILSIGGNGSTVTGGEGNDTIVTSSDSGETSLVDAGVGADFIVSDDSAAVETIIFESGDSVAATKNNFSTTPGSTIQDGTITFGNKVDVITGFNDTAINDNIDIDFKAAGFNLISAAEANTTILETNEIYAVQGTASADFGTFKVDIGVVDTTTNTVVSGGTDFLYIVGGSNLTLGQVFTNSDNMFVSDALIATSQFV